MQQKMWAISSRRGISFSLLQARYFQEANHFAQRMLANPPSRSKQGLLHLPTELAMFFGKHPSVIIWIIFLPLRIHISDDFFDGKNICVL